MDKIFINDKELVFGSAPSPKHKLAGDVYDLCIDSNLEIIEYLGAIESAKWALQDRWLQVVQRDRAMRKAESGL